MMMPMEEVVRQGYSAVVFNETYGLAWQYLIDQHPQRADEIKNLWQELQRAARHVQSDPDLSVELYRRVTRTAAEIAKEWQQEEDPWFMRDPDQEDDEPEPEGPDLGPCCECKTTGRQVRNIVMLDIRSPEPGIGCWGCLACDLPQAGAVAVLCDACLERTKGHPNFFCLGSPAEGRRAPVTQWHAKFEHDMTKHPEAVDENYGYTGAGTGDQED